MSYILDAILVEQEVQGNMAGTLVAHERPSRGPVWLSAHESLEAATEQFEELSKRPDLLALVLIEWQPGENGDKFDRPLRHPSSAQRGCAGCIPTERVLRHGDRLWIEPHHRGAGFSCDWQEHPESAGMALSTSPPGCYKLTPRSTKAYLGGSNGRELYYSNQLSEDVLAVLLAAGYKEAF